MDVDTDSNLQDHWLRIVDFNTARDLSDRSILTVRDMPGNITIFQRGAFWVDSKGAYVVGGDVNDEPWVSREGEWLQSNFSAYKGGTVFRYDLEANQWSSRPARRSLLTSTNSTRPGNVTRNTSLAS